MGERLFSCIFQQRPLDDEGAFFNLDKVIFHDEAFDERTPHSLCCRSWDLAYSDASKGDINDSTAGVLMYKINENHFVISDIQHGQYGEGLKAHLKNIAQSDGVNVNILIEAGTKGGASKFLYQEYASYLQGYRTYQSEPIGSKSDRAYAFRQAILDGKIHVHLRNERVRGEFIKQLRGFPLIKHDDVIDACSYAFNFLNKHGGCVVSVGRIRPRTDIMGNPYIPNRRGNPLIRKRYY